MVLSTLAVVRRSVTVALVGSGIVAASAACSGAGSCRDSECATGNRCIAFKGETRCRRPCGSNSDPATSCPFGYTCTDPLDGTTAICVQDAARTADGRAIVQGPLGTWGARCQANLGRENPGCDTAQGFVCHGISPTDANAYCTRAGCTRNDECGAGFWCGTVNATPNVTSARRTTIGEVGTVCLRRSFCAPCSVDLDCPRIEGREQRCVADANGSGLCAPQCTENANCPNEAQCADLGLPSKVCFPRANQCVGDGSLCSPCRADTDCGDDGICVKGEFTTERFCAKAAAGGKCASCPDTIPSPRRAIGCAARASEGLPAGYCVGLYRVGGTLGGDIGCWTPDR